MKLLMKVLGLVLLFVIVVAIAFVVLVDPNEYKQEIEQQVQQATGRTLSIGGDIGLSIIPIGIELEKVELSNAEGFEQDRFASIDSLVIKAEVIPLLRSTLVVDALQLEGLSLFLEVDADGNTNWQDLASGGGAEDAVAPAAEQASDEAGSTASLAALAINGIAITEANILFDDRQNDNRISVSGFSLTTGEIAFGEAFDVALRASVERAAAGVTQQLDLAVDAAVTIEQSLQQFALDGLTLAVNANLPQFEALELGMSLTAAIDLATETASIRDARIEAFDNLVELEVQVSDWSDDLGVNGELSTGEVKLRELTDRFDVVLPPMQAADAVTVLTLSSPFSMKAGKVSAKPSVRFDETNIDAELDVTLDTLAVRYRLDLDSIDVNRYMPPPPPEEAEPDATDNADVPEEELPIPSELIRTLDVAGDISIGKASVLDYELAAISISNAVKDGVVTVSPATLEALKGKIIANVKLDVRMDTPVFSVDMKADDIHLGPVADPILLKVIQGQQVNATGSGDVFADVTSRGKKVSALMQASRGKFGFRFADSKLQGLDVDQFGKAALKQAIDDAGNPLGYSYEYTERYDPETKTAFDIMRGDFTIDQGMAVSDNLLMDGSKARMSGKAEIDIVQQKLDSTVIANRKIASPGSELEQLENEPISVRVYGPFDALQFDPDYSKIIGAISRIARDKASKAIEEKKAKLKQKLDNKVDKPELDSKKQKLDEKKDELKDKLKQKLKLF